MFGAVACNCDKSTDAAKPEPSGVAASGLTTVLAACQHRVAWERRLRKPCVKCMSLAAAPKCGCKNDTKPYSALCSAEQRAKLDAKASCDEVFECSYKCKRTDCACQAKCFEGQDKCHAVAVALDTCLIESCDTYCSAE